MSASPQIANTHKLDMGARIDAIEAAAQGLASEDPDAEETLRALATSTAESTTASQREGLSDAARMLAAAPAQELPAHAAGLVKMLREAAASQRPEPAIYVIGGEPRFHAELAAILITSGRAILHAPSASDAKRMLKQRPAVCAVLSASLPDLDSRTLLTRLREDSATAGVPVLLLGVRLDEASKEDSRLHAADGYLEQPRDAAAVAQWILGRLRRTSDTPKSARRDILTGLLNRAAFCESFVQIQRDCTAANDPLSLAAISVDSSRAMLHQFDAETREEILQAFGLVLSNSLRTTDVVARVGLYEFAALFPGEDESGATRAVEKVISRLREQAFRTATGQSVSLAVAAGITLIKADTSMEDALAHAERFVYEAAARGGNVVVSEPVSQPPTHRPRVLLLVREPRTTQVLQQLLEKEHFYVASKDTWTADSVEQVGHQRFHLVVVDEHFSAPNGLAVLKSLRQDPANSRVPIIVLVAKNSESSIAEALECGANDYITRPFSPQAFVSRARRLLARGIASGHDLCRILVVSDDSSPLVMAGSALFQRGGFEILLALGGKDCIERIEREAPDVLLVDTPIGDVGQRPFWSVLEDKLARLPVAVVVAEHPQQTTSIPHLYPIAIRGRVTKPLSPLKIGVELEAALGLRHRQPMPNPSLQQLLNDEIRRVTRRS